MKHQEMINLLEQHYRLARQLYDTDLDFKKGVEQTVCKLQAKDPELLRWFFAIRAVSVAESLDIYETLNVPMPLSSIRGESFYAGIRPVNESDIKFARERICNDGIYRDEETC